MTMTMLVILSAAIGAVISGLWRERGRAETRVVDYDDYDRGWAEGYGVAKSEARRDYQLGYDEGYFAAQSEAPKKAVKKVKITPNKKEQ